MTSLEWFRTRAAGPRELPEFPTLDDALRWYLMGLEQVPAALEAACHYAEDVRQGRWPDRVEPRFSLQAIYLALAQETLLGRADRAAFEREVSVLFDAVREHLEAGRGLLDEPFLKISPALQKYVAQLTDDARLFDEDLRRGSQHRVSLPAQASTTGAARTVLLLALDRPASTQFKLWARQRCDAALLLVRQPDGTLVVSADPSRKLRLDWLAERLSTLDVHRWYSGERHGGTLIASSKEGTSLDFGQVLSAMGAKPLQGRRAPLLLVAGLVAAAAVLVLGLTRRPGVTVSSSGGAKGEVVSRAGVIDLLAAQDGPRSFEPYALVAGVCGYSGERTLHAPCRDARAVRELLVTKLGYQRDHILFFVDRPEPGEATDGEPTAENLKLAVERFRQRFPTADETSSFLFYYSGHGGFEAGARKDFGVLQPAGYFEHPERPISERGWDMQELVDDLRKGVPARHVMVILDACYSGWAAGAKGDARRSGELRSLWNERAEVVISAAARGQRAWEDEAAPAAWAWNGHSALTAFLLEGLGRAQADANGDRVITDDELASFLTAKVPAAVRQSRQAEQTPQFHRFDEHLPRSGQFLFLPPEP
ncbi:MAG: caspase family protein [Myxococcaceae bacterium]|nr:caspase family protein [Myxococcaceae bacterium]